MSKLIALTIPHFAAFLGHITLLRNHCEMSTVQRNFFLITFTIKINVWFRITRAFRKFLKTVVFPKRANQNKRNGKAALITY